MTGLCACLVYTELHGMFCNLSTWLLALYTCTIMSDDDFDGARTPAHYVRGRRNPKEADDEDLQH